MARIWMKPSGGNSTDLTAVTATAADVLQGKVIIGANGKPLTGNMANKGAWNGSVAMNGTVAIPAGYHNGSGKVTGPAITNRGNYGGTGNSRGNDTSGQRMWVKVPGGYYNENAQVFLNWADIRSMAGLTPDKIKKNVSIMGITGTHDGFVPGPMDIYNRGSWGAGYGTASVAPANSNGSISYNINHIYNMHRRNGVANGFNALISNQGNPFNLQPYSTVNVVYSTQNSNDSVQCVRLFLLNSSSIRVTGLPSAKEKTITLNISSFNGTSTIGLDSLGSNVPGGIFIYRIYFT